MHKTVVELDLIGYSRIARELEDNLTVKIVSALNAQIQGLVDQGLAGIGVTRQEAVIGTAGDNAILLFDRAEQAHRFAEAVHAACKAHNAEKTTPAARRWFRIGAATGEIDRSEQDGSQAAAGTTIIRAVRLESAGAAGQLLIDEATYEALPKALRHRYGGAESVKVKDGTLSARRCVFVPEVIDIGAVPTVDDLYDRLREVPSLKLKELVHRLRMPADYRPGDSAPPATVHQAIVGWAEGRADLYRKIDALAQDIIAKQRP